MTRNLHLYRDQQREARWEEREGAREVYGSTVGIVGLGDLGREIGRRARALGCTVLGTRRGAEGPVDQIDAVLPLDDLLPRADFLVLALPNTPDTQGIIGRERLARLKKGGCALAPHLRPLTGSQR